MDKHENQLKKGFKQKEKQDNLKSQYGIEKDVFVIEKKSSVAQTVKAILSFSLTVLRIIATILLVLLAIIGLMAIIYPEIRQELILAIRQIISEVSHMIGRSK